LCPNLADLPILPDTAKFALPEFLPILKDCATIDRIIVGTGACRTIRGQIIHGKSGSSEFIAHV
jgi:hypothetical protein